MDIGEIRRCFICTPYYRRHPDLSKRGLRRKAEPRLGTPLVVITKHALRDLYMCPNCGVGVAVESTVESTSTPVESTSTP